MTIIELLDEKPINNIVGVLAFKPDKVVYVGGHTEKQFNRKELPILKGYFSKKGYNALEVEYVQVRRDSLKDIIDKLEKIYSANIECKFHVEITGGEDLILIGLGVLCQRHPEIELYQISGKLRSIRSFSVSNADCRKLDIECRNTVEENLILHGASILSSNGTDILSSEYRWDNEFLQDIEAMWNISCCGIEKHPVPFASNAWNKVTTLLASIDADNAERENGNNNNICIDSDYFKKEILNGINGSLFYDYICYFVRCGLMDCHVETEYTYLAFKNNQVRLCLTKAVQILELKVYLICLKLLSQRGGDCLTGVTIDWNGDENLASTVRYLYDSESYDSAIDTTNEIDVIASCGLTPYFISCKNGKFNSEELYKLYSVCERFSGGYGKKIIVTTNSAYAMGEERNVIFQRAVDMGISVIENVHQKTDDEIADELKAVMELPKVKMNV